VSNTQRESKGRRKSHEASKFTISRRGIAVFFGQQQQKEDEYKHVLDMSRRRRFGKRNRVFRRVRLARVLLRVHKRVDENVEEEEKEKR
jgi:hypothetical protein